MSNKTAGTVIAGTGVRKGVGNPEFPTPFYSYYYTTKMRKNTDWYVRKCSAIIINPDRRFRYEACKAAQEDTYQEGCILKKRVYSRMADRREQAVKTSADRLDQERQISEERQALEEAYALEEVQIGKLLEQVSDQAQIGKILETNQYTQKYGLVLSEEEARMIVAERKDTLRAEKRVEFGQGILPRLIYEFCDSYYITQDNYAKTMVRLQEIFYLYKNETMDELTDSELIHFMKEQFENVCYGDLDYLEGTCLDIFSQAVRGGYRGYRRTEGRGEYGQFDEVQRWDPQLYMEALKALQ